MRELVIVVRMLSNRGLSLFERRSPLDCDRPGDAGDWFHSRLEMRSCERLGFRPDVQLDKRNSAATVNEIPCAGRPLAGCTLQL